MAQSAAIVGLGRIGLPLALSLADRGLEVIGIDKDRTRLDTVAAGQMPFDETGTQELLERVLSQERLKLTDAIADAAAADFIVLTLGTPAHLHLEIDISQIRSVVDDLLPLLREGQTLILRSTVAPSCVSSSVGAPKLVPRPSAFDSAADTVAGTVVALPVTFIRPCWL